MYSSETVATKIDRLTKVLPLIRQCLTPIFIDDLQQLIINYLLHYPLSHVVQCKEDETFIPRLIKDTEFSRYRHYKDRKLNYFKHFVSLILTTQGWKFQVLEMYQDKPPDVGDKNYPCTPYQNGKWHGFKFLIPKTPVFDFFTKFLICPIEDILTMLNFNVGDNLSNDYIQKLNPCNEMFWGYYDARDNFWHFKIWIVHFFYDICCYLLNPATYILPTLESAEEDLENSYPMTSNSELDHSYSFPIQFENEICNYFVGFYKRGAIESFEDYNRQYNHYFIEIKSVRTKKLKYCRGSMVGINPASAMIFYLISRRDSQLSVEYPYIPPDIFRHILLQKLYLIYDWN